MYNDPRRNDTWRELRWFNTVLLLIFITLKLSGVIAWSWWWVMAPFWVPLALTILALLIVRFL